jgi:hypothetical protein
MRRPHWLSRLFARKACPECGAHAETYCEACGYDLVRKTRAQASLYRRQP